MARTPAAGEPAPDFTLPGVLVSGGAAQQAGYTLSEHRGAPLVLAFYPGDSTSVCTRQLCSYASGMEEFTTLGAAVWGISPQGLDSHERFAREQGLTFPLLADTELAVTQQYGIGLGSSLRRSVFVVDAAGVLRWKHVTLVGLTFPKAATITGQLRALAG
jgi:peroxiredoxin Q/BCP